MVWANLFQRGQPQELTSPGPYGYLPSGQEEEYVSPEGEEPIDAEYRFIEEGSVEEEPAGGPVRGGRYEDIEAARRVREAARFGEKLERERAEASLAKQRLEKLKLEKEKASIAKLKQERRIAVEKEVVRWGTRAVTLGGVPAVQRAGGIRDMYFGRAKQSLYVPTAPKPSAGSRTGVPAAEALRPDLGQLREATRLGTPSVRGMDVTYARRLVEGPGRDKDLGYGFLKELTMPKGLSRVEHAAFAEIHANGDVDTLEHIKSELARLGFPRNDAERAVKMLEEKGLVVRSEDKKGKPAIYEIARRV